MDKVTKKTRTIIVGVDVGGTNTDAVFFEKESKKVLGSAKTATTKDVTSGIMKAIKLSFPSTVSTSDVRCLSIGTTVFINAILERSAKLAKVTVFRLCGPSTAAITPFETIPKGLRSVIEGHWKMLSGGYEFTGKEISTLDLLEIEREIEVVKAKGITRFVVSGVNSPINPDQEQKVKELILRRIPDASVTLSNEVGQLGLIERENASILNEALRPLAQFTVKGFQNAFKQLKLDCAFYLTQNDGTLISARRAMQFPIFCISSGPTNSCRGAHFLTGLKNAIVVDIGGTTTDVGALVDGFPRLSQTYVNIGGTRTNFRIPDVQSIALGGGSIVKKNIDGVVTVGPQSVGFELETKSRVFGGNVLTTTDICVVRDGVGIGNEEDIKKLRREINQEFVEKVSVRIHEMANDVIDLMKSNSEKIPVVLVGGGVILVSEKHAKFEYIKPENAGVANAIGAAIANVSGSLNECVVMVKGNGDKEEDEKYRLDQLKRLREKVVGYCVSNGAEKGTVKVVYEDEFELGYVGALSGQKRVVMRAIGEIKEFRKLSFDVPDVEFDVDAKEKVLKKNSEEDDRTEMIRIDKHYKPNIVDGEWVPNFVDLRAISIGSGILGCGGGGSTFVGEMIARKYLGKIKILPPSAIPDDGVVGGVAFMGAPSVLVEKIPSGTECIASVEKIKELSGANFCGLTCLEIGGLNSTTPLYVAAKMGLPLYDCDSMGRAFPELQMCTNFIYGDRFNPTCLSNEKGDFYAKTDAKSCKDVENDLRVVVFGKYGGVGGIALPPSSKKEVMETMVHNSYSQAWRIGKSVLVARCTNTDPVSAILEVTKGRLLFKGKIVELNKKKISGFDKVVMKLEGYEEFHDSKKLEIIVQNENLVATIDGKVVACVPDCISLVNPDDGEIIQTDSLQFGLRCSVVAFPCVDVLKTEKAMKVLGPKAFKLNDVEYNEECGKCPKFKSVFDEE